MLFFFKIKLKERDKMDMIFGKGKDNKMYKKGISSSQNEWRRRRP